MLLKKQVIHSITSQTVLRLSFADRILAVVLNVVLGLLWFLDQIQVQFGGRGQDYPMGGGVCIQSESTQSLLVSFCDVSSCQQTLPISFKSLGNKKW